MYRQELKFYMSSKSATIVKSRLNVICRHDDNSNNNGGYRVSSLYFDDFCNSAIFDNLDGQINRAKFRIRTYNGSDSLIRLEKKIKHNIYGMKDSVLISADEYKKILARDYEFLKYGGEIQEEFYRNIKTKLLKPKVIIDYYREAFVYPYGDVRITFDSDLRLSIGNCDIFDKKNIFTPVTNEGEIVMEVKFTGYLPEHIKDMIQIGEQNRQAFSKYVAGRTFINH